MSQLRIDGASGMIEAGSESQRLFVGWDVGGWNCDKNANSRDALFVLDRSGAPVGKPWRGNLRCALNDNVSAREFLSTLINLCDLNHRVDIIHVTIAIDAPLAFPEALVRLITGREPLAQIDDKSAENKYLYRFTERRLASEGTIRPLSSIKDMIGSQATKAMHMMSRFNLQPIEPGVWSDDGCLTVIETYPSLCRLRLDHVQDKQEPRPTGTIADIRDARICAQIAYDFHFRRERLESPTQDAPIAEGWIWAPLP